MPIPKVISISAKCSDLFSASLLDENDGVLGEYTGYVPEFFPEEHYGDYVQLDIDLESGKILNWNKPTVDQLNEIFSKEEEEEENL